MKILFVTRKFPPSKGGMEKVAFDLFNHLSKSQEVVLLKPPRGISGILALPILYSMLTVKMVSGNYDLIFLQDGLLSPIISLGRIFNIPTVVNGHGLDIVYPNPLYQSIIRFFLPEADRVICVSNATRNACLERGVDANRSSVIPNGIDCESWGGMSSSVVDRKASGDETNGSIILFVGRLIRRKGIHWFISDVFPLIASKADVNLVVIGDGEYRDEIQRASEESLYHNKIQILGRVDDETLVDAYNKASVMVFPNIPKEEDLEGFGLCNLEGPFFGVPVIASRLDGISEAVLEGVTGQLVEPLDEDEFAEAVMEVLNGNEKFNRNRMVEEIRERFDWSNIVPRYISEFREVLNEKNSSC